MKRAKRTFTQDEKELVFNLWKQGTGFSDIGIVLDAAPGTVFTALRETGGIKPRTRTRNAKHLTIAEREEIRVALSAKTSLRAIARMLNRSPSTISREIARNRGRRYYKAVDADNRARRMAKRPKFGILELNSALRRLVMSKLELKWCPEQISGWLSIEFSRSKQMQVSHETIYKSMYVRAKGVSITLLRNICVVAGRCVIANIIIEVAIGTSLTLLTAYRSMIALKTLIIASLLVIGKVIWYQDRKTHISLR